MISHLVTLRKHYLYLKMTNKDFSLYYRKKYNSVAELNFTPFDFFISAFNDSERVQTVFENVPANNKFWLILPEYGYKPEQIPTKGTVLVFNEDQDESDVVISLFDQIGINFQTQSVCVDITGFIRPHLVFLVRYLATVGIKVVSFIYTDPVKYIKKENTDFSLDHTEIRQIIGCEGSHFPNATNDYLLIGAGYDYQRINDVSVNKADTKKVQLFGFPSLQPDMYQENILKAYKAEENSSGIDPELSLFAPANDPFITAAVIQKYIQRENRRSPITNLYLCPLSTKAQTLGFALYYVFECLNEPVSVIFPFSSKYSRETTEGVSKIWMYVVEFN